MNIGVMVYSAIPRLLRITSAHYESVIMEYY